MRVAIDTEFEVLFREQYPRLVAIGIALTNSHEVANDLAQETMARAHAKWADVSTADSPTAWLRTVMKNLVIDHYRRQESDRSKTSRLASAARAERTRAASIDAEGAAASMVDLLQLLPERQRIAVALRYVDDLSVAEMSDVLSIANGTVKATLWKARRTLERHLRTESQA